ncbi:hypothetical protein DERP_009703 [Dermatophagoides pteronyssinus]|uniref:Uncharacterized protein n=1 Tax=Dermatophagoides pteronyssinus TaxID=6956 RepID=A0ABQ8JAM2_DERPT|nr:hypothetical protein DERP_009703 [Dermatophagoides pteronyssinus]
MRSIFQSMKEKIQSIRSLIDCGTSNRTEQCLTLSTDVDVVLLLLSSLNLSNGVEFMDSHAVIRLSSIN